MKGIEQFLQVDAATLGALKYAGTWNASTNTPTLASGVGVQGQYYVVSVAGSTNLDGETNWQVGDWAVFNGSVWQKVDGGSTGLLTTLTVTGNTYLATTSGDVGIGTTSPANKLHVTGTGSTPTLFERTGSNGVYLQLKDASGASVFLGADNGLFAVQTPGSSYSNKLVVDSSGNVGIGTSSPAYKLDVLIGAGSGNLFRAGQSGVSNGYTITSNGSALTHFWATTGEAMRLDSSGNLGIGTSSPGAKLHSLATTNPAIFASSDATALFTTYQYNTSTVCGYIGNGAGVVTGAGASNFGVRAENSLVFAAGGNNERMRLDASGNLGLGVTPSAWVAGSRALQLGATGYTALSQGTGGDSNLTSNVYLSAVGTWTAIASLGASRYQLDFGAHRWYTAPSGTAGNAISFTQAMTLDGSGDLIVGGTTTNSIRLTAEKSNPTRGIIAHVVNSGSSGLTGSQIMFTQNTVNNWAVGQPAGVDAFAFWSSRNTAADGTERMRIDASGNLLVGTTSTSALTAFSGSAVGQVIQSGVPVLALVDSDDTTNGVVWLANSSGVGYLYTKAANPFVFGTNNAERARIPAAGGMVVGTAAIATTATDGFLYVPTCAGTPTGTPTTQTGTAPIVIDTTNNKLYFYSGGQWRDAGP